MPFNYELRKRHKTLMHRSEKTEASEFLQGLLSKGDTAGYEAHLKKFKDCDFEIMPTKPDAKLNPLTLYVQPGEDGISYFATGMKKPEKITLDELEGADTTSLDKLNAAELKAKILQITEARGHFQRPEFRKTANQIFQIYNDPNLTMVAGIKFQVKGSVMTWYVAAPMDETYQSWRDILYNSAANAHVMVTNGCDKYYRGTNRLHVKKMHTTPEESLFNHNHYRVDKGSRLLISDSLPKDLENYRDSHFLINKDLIYIRADALAERVVLPDFAQFQFQLSALLKGKIPGVILTQQDTQNLITAATGHAPLDEDCELHQAESLPKDLENYIDHYFWVKNELFYINYGETAEKIPLKDPKTFDKECEKLFRQRIAGVRITATEVTATITANGGHIVEKTPCRIFLLDEKPKDLARFAENYLYIKDQLLQVTKQGNAIEVPIRDPFVFQQMLKDLNPRGTQAITIENSRVANMLITCNGGHRPRQSLAGVNLHLLTELPASFAPYRDSYLLISNSGTQKLYFINDQDMKQSVEIQDFNKLLALFPNADKEQKHTPPSIKATPDTPTVYLTAIQAQSLITENAAHGKEGHSRPPLQRDIEMILEPHHLEVTPRDVEQHLIAFLSQKRGPEFIDKEEIEEIVYKYRVYWEGWKHSERANYLADRTQAMIGADIKEEAAGATHKGVCRIDASVLTDSELQAYQMEKSRGGGSNLAHTAEATGSALTHLQSAVVVKEEDRSINKATEEAAKEAREAAERGRCKPAITITHYKPGSLRESFWERKEHDKPAQASRTDLEEKTRDKGKGRPSITGKDETG